MHKRYTIDQPVIPHARIPEIEMSEDAAGGWVKYDDYMHMKNRLDLAMNQLEEMGCDAQWYYDQAKNLVDKLISPEEGAVCLFCGEGHLAFEPDGVCSCHRNPPCSACFNSVLVCNLCGVLPDEL